MKIVLDHLVLDSKEKCFANDLNMVVEDSLVFLGPSSCGKSYLMSVIAGVATPESGKILINGQEVFNTDDEEQLNLRKRTGVIFYRHTLLSNLTLFANLKLFLVATRSDLDDQAIDELIDQKLGEANLMDKKHAKIVQISDGQLKMASFIKATIHSPHLLLWDSPFENVPREYHDFMTKELDRLVQNGTLIMCFTGDRVVAERLNFNIEELEKEKLRMGA